MTKKWMYRLNWPVTFLVNLSSFSLGAVEAPFTRFFAALNYTNPAVNLNTPLVARVGVNYFNHWLDLPEAFFSEVLNFGVYTEKIDRVTRVHIQNIKF